MSSKAMSAAFFCPRTRPPPEDYLTELRDFLRQCPHGNDLLYHVVHLEESWPLFANARSDIAALSDGVQDVRLLVDWVNGGPTSPICEARTSIVALPLLLILQLGQYLRYLEVNGISHDNFLGQVRHAGGIHGYCGGAAAALSIATAKDEAQVIENAAVLLRVVMGIGAVMEATDDARSSDPTTIAIRLKHEEQGEELVRLFPGTYISAVTEPKSISIVGPGRLLAQLTRHARGLGLPVHVTDITGRAHSPGNRAVAMDLIALLNRTPPLQLPESTYLRVPFRSNRTGETVEASFMEDMVIMMLTSRCEWHTLLGKVAEDMKNSRQALYSIVVFGMDDCVPMSQFHSKQVPVSKFEARSLAFRSEPSSLNSFKFPDSTIAIIGVSCRLPGANNIEELWELVSGARDCHQEIPSDRFISNASFREAQSGGHNARKKSYGNFIDDVERFDCSFFGINPREAANMDPQQRILLELSYEALESSGYLATHVRDAGDSVGCFIGGSFVEYLDNTNAHAPTAYTSTGTIRGFLCGRLSYYYGWTGPSEVIDTACSSSLVAINRACKALQGGECSMALAGGVNVITGLNNFLDLGKAGFLSSTGQCKAFDAAANGYCRAEGAGLVLLKPLQQAIQAGDNILGVLPSTGTNQGGLSTLLTVPSSSALQSLYSSILDQATLKPSDISYVEAHATGTQAGDPVEMESIRAVFSDTSRSTSLAIGSIKGNIGHCETAAGVAGLLKVLVMIRHQQIPPQANFNCLNPNIPPLEFDCLEIPRSLRFWKAPLRVALVNSYGAAGSNAALLCCEMTREKAAPAQPAGPNQTKVMLPLIVSAASHQGVITQARALAAYLRKSPTSITLADVSYTLNHRRKRHRFCAMIEASDIPNAARSLECIKSPSFKYTNEPPPIVLVLGGQNGGKVNLSHELLDAYPVFRTYIDKCDAQLLRLGYPSLFPAIFDDHPLPDTFSLQCGLFAVQYACASCWIDAGLKIDAIVGHSFGELVGLAVSGALSFTDAIELVASRARLIDTQWGHDKGSMLAIHAGPGDVERLLAVLRSTHPEANLNIACYNGPQSVVVAGPSASVQLAERMLCIERTFATIRHQRLSTTHAFHSFLTQPILPGVDLMAANLSWNEPTLPLEFCTYDAMTSIKEWTPSRHMREPVYFMNAVRRIEQRLGRCVWLEAGLEASAIPMAKKAVANPPTHTFWAIDSNSRRGDSHGMISQLISGLCEHGILLKHWALLNEQPKQVWLPPYQFERQHYWVENIDRAYEASQKLAGSERNGSAARVRTTRSLVTRGQSHFLDAPDFWIDDQCDRFQKIVAGHAVMGQALCPASMYMECVTMAAQLLIGGPLQHSLRFDDLEFLSPLGTNLGQRIRLSLEVSHPNKAWKFTIASYKSTSTSREMIHCRGKLTLTHDPELAVFSQLLGCPFDKLELSGNAERLMSNRAYGLFSRVVHYEPFLKGIRSILIQENEATATVELPDDQPDWHESTVRQRCDGVLADTFISTAGLLINSSDCVSHRSVMVATAIERCILSPACRMDDQHSWDVYVRFVMIDDANATSDIFVYSSERELVTAFTGVRFAKVGMDRLEKTLQSVNAKRPKPLDHYADDTSSSSEPTHPVIYTPNENDPASFASTHQTPESFAAETDRESAIKSLITNLTGLREADISGDALLCDMGIDSLSSIELSSEIQIQVGISLDSSDIARMSFADLMKHIVEHDSNIPDLPTHQNPHQGSAFSTPGSHSVPAGRSSAGSYCWDELAQDPIVALAELESRFDQYCCERGFANYWRDVHPLQQELLEAYILEAFTSLGAEVAAMQPGNQIQLFTRSAKYDRLVSRLLEILEASAIVHMQDRSVMRGQGKLPSKSSSELHDSFILRFPQYAPEADLMRLTGSKLAQCLSGSQDPVSLIFGSRLSAKTMEQYYHHSPMLSVFTDLLVEYVAKLIRGVKKPVKILEVGAGTGGTTRRLAEALEATGVSCQYTFTDLSPTLVAQAKRMFARYPWMEFATLDLEKEVHNEFRNQYHIAIGTNCVHATRDRIASCARLRETLTDNGLLILSEVTRIIDWYDICFGLLDGWWYAGNGTEYPLQPSSVWMEAFRVVGFPAFGFSRGGSHEATTQQLLVGHNSRTRVASPKGPSASILYHVETMKYKTVKDVDILADVYVPHTVHSGPRPIALLIHGGGHMTLSRKAIRPAQTNYLIENGFLPVSLDYRLCPEVNLIDGPITDVRDGYWWARSKMPLELLNRGILVDSDSVVVIGWSTGGHLAMAICWMAKEADMPLPTAVLSFYAPVDLESGELDREGGTSLPRPKMDLSGALKAVARKPITNYGTDTTDKSGLGWVRPGDPRCELLLHVFRSRVGLPLLLNGLPTDTEVECLAIPSNTRIAAVSPMARVLRGDYDVPTFIVHGSDDDIAPIAAAERMIGALKQRGVKHGFLSVEGVGHVFDLDIRPGTERWEKQIDAGYRFLFGCL